MSDASIRPSDAEFLRGVARNLSEGVGKVISHIEPETVERLRELADRCEADALPSMTLEAEMWKLVEISMENGWNEEAADDVKIRILYLIACQLKTQLDLKAENERLLVNLKKYGDHRWKCAITRAIREQRKPGEVECDCGWEQVALIRGGAHS